MMLLSAAPAAGHVARLAGWVQMRTALFVAVYLVGCTVYGLAAYGDSSGS